jgi:hypothetical protein
MWAMICVFGLVLSGAAQAEIVWQPPWVEDPSDLQWQGGSVTHQVWEFNDDPIVPMISENPFGLAQIEVVGGSYPDPVIGPDGVTLLNTWHIDQDGGSLVISVPNDPRPNDRKVIFIQLTSDKGPLLGYPTSNPPGTVSYPKPAINHDGTGWYTYTAQIDIPFNPPFETITYCFPESTNISELVVDSICVPEPASLSLLAVGGLALLRRRCRAIR